MTNDHVTQVSADAKASSAPRAKKVSLGWIRSASVVAGVALLFIVFSALTSSFYAPNNLLDILLQSSINAMIAVGMTLVVMARGIDLSVGRWLA
jgi:ribose transport system permease protein